MTKKEWDRGVVNGVDGVEDVQEKQSYWKNY
jgi:hypothetical protein